MDESIRLQVGVKVFLKNRNGKYLLLERSPAKYPEIKNNWDIPGGKIFPGTSLLENLKREVYEEARLKILGEPRLLSAQDIIRGKEKHIVRLTYIAQVVGDPVLNEEHVNFIWVTISEMKKFKKLDGFTREILEKNFSEII